MSEEENDTQWELAAWEMLAEAKEQLDAERALADRLEREREELKNQLIDAKSSTAFWMGKYNNAVQLRGKDPLCDSFWKTLDKLAAERALADRLAGVLELYYADDDIAHHAGIADALAAWKEARSE